ncbi:hypothetical protein MKW98_001727 [Papaver atlanticum]|uniref:Methionyl/Leucyl tRNA synthetase domain-containing protein n=1 Tax=Papaver atlanticum TaxID=357466 RepID=A0AAD4S6B6_9MAGN|nr:hypothetical protein MKW98_001727 [Papaver atlanticum]
MSEITNPKFWDSFFSLVFVISFTYQGFNQLHSFSQMANKEMDAAKSYARADKLLEIERTWWDESDVFRAESCEEPPKLVYAIVVRLIDVCFMSKYPPSFCQMANKEMDGAKSYARRDKLLEIERNVQTWWDESDVFRTASCEKPPKLGETSYGYLISLIPTLLHLGHAFSLSKLEFAAAYQLFRGANVLLPIGFHCTGMPIKASADKLAWEIMADKVYVFCEGPYAKLSTISQSVLHKMRQEYSYWYPFDLTVTGKELIQNHLTFTIYHHTALFPQHHRPCGFRCKGHIMLNSEKMSKSTGNFKTLRQTIEDFSVDATRHKFASIELQDLRPRITNTYLSGKTPGERD